MGVTFEEGEGPFAITPLTDGFAAEISGIDASRELPIATIEALEKAIAHFGVLVLRDQPLTEDEQVRFAERFGPLDAGLNKLKKSVSSVAPQKTRLKYDAVADISNLGMDDKVLPRDDPRVISNIANQLWHSDSSFQQPAARYSMLSALTVAPKGGETQFADMRAAYDALDDDQKSEIETLEAEHFALHSRIMLGVSDWSPEALSALPPVTWPIVRTHPLSQRKLLFIGAHASNVKNMTIPEGRMLLQDLLEHATRSRFVYTHHWRVNDLVIWDNRATLHRGRRFDPSVRREMRRSTTSDDCPHVGESDA